MATMSMPHGISRICFSSDMRVFSSRPDVGSSSMTRLPCRQSVRARSSRRSSPPESACASLPICVSMDAPRAAYHFYRPALASTCSSALSSCALPENMLTLSRMEALKTKDFCSRSVTCLRNAV